VWQCDVLPAEQDEKEAFLPLLSHTITNATKLNSTILIETQTFDI